MSAAEKEAAGSTLGLGTAFKGLGVEIKKAAAESLRFLAANPTLLALAGIATVIGIVGATVANNIKKEKEYQESLKESVSAMGSATSEQKNTVNSLESLTKKYEELSEQLKQTNLTQEETYQIKSDLYGVQCDLIDNFGDEAKGIDLVNGSYSDQLQLLKGIKKENANSYLTENKNEYEKNHEYVTSRKDYKSGYFYVSGSGYKPLNNDLKYLLESNGLKIEEEVMGATGGGYSGTIQSYRLKIEDMTKEEIYNLSQNVSKILRDASEENIDIANDPFTEYLQNYFTELTSQTIDFDELSLAKQNTEYYEQLSAQASEAFGDLYSDLITARNNYAASLQSHENVEENKAIFDAAWGDFTESSKIASQEVRNAFDSVHNSISEEIIKQNSWYDKLIDSKELELIKSLNLTDVELKGINWDDINSSSAEDAFRELLVYLEASGDEIDHVISLLTNMDAIMGGVSSSANMEAIVGGISSPSGLDDPLSFKTETLSKSLDDLSKIQSLYHSFFNNGEYGVTIDYSSVEALREALGDTCESFDEFEKIVTDSTTSDNEKQKSFDKLISEYVYASDVLAGLDSSNVNSRESQLALKGIYEETEGTLSSLAIVNEELRKSGQDVSTVTLEEANSFLASGAATGVARQQFASYILSKNTINGVKLDTADEIRQFQQIAEAAGVSATYCDLLAEALTLQEAYDNADNDFSKIAILGKLTALKGKLKNDAAEVIGDIGSQFKTIINPPSVAKSASSAVDTIKQAFDEEKDYLDYLRKAEIITDTEYYNRLSELNEQYYQNSKDHAKEYRDYALECQQALQKLAVEALEIQLKDMDKAVSAVQKKLDKQIKSIEKQKDAIKSKYDTEMNALQSQIDALDGQKDELQEVNDAKQTTLDLEQKLYELSRAQNQRVNQVFNGEQFVYEADAASIKNAAQAVDEARLKQTISEIEQTQKRLKETKDSLQAALQEEIAVLDAEIEKLQDYKYQWGEVSSAYEESQNDLMAAQLLGKDWESKILAARLDTMQDFCNKYIELQNKIAEANKAIAEQSQEKLSGADLTSPNSSSGSSGYSGSKGNGNDNSDPKPVTITYYYLEDIKGNQVSGLYTSYSEAKSKIPYNPGAEKVSDKTITKTLSQIPQYASGVKDLDDNQIAWTQEQGREIVISPSTGAVLTPLRQGDSVLKNDFTENLFKWAEINPEALQAGMMDAVRCSIPNMNMINHDKTPVVQHITLTLPNVTNNSGIEYLKQELKGLPLAALQYSTKRN